MSVLITGAAAAGAHRLQRALDLTEVVFADQQDLPGTLFSKTKFIQIPPGNSSTFAHQLLTLSLDHSIDMIFPLRRDEVLALAEAKKLFEEYNIEIIIPESTLLNKFLDNSSSAGDEFVVVKEGMVLSGQLLDENDLPAQTGLFVCSAEKYSELKLFIVN